MLLEILCDPLTQYCHADEGSIVKVCRLLAATVNLALIYF